MTEEKPKPTRKPNAWLVHLKESAKARGITFQAALADESIRAAYKSSKGGGSSSSGSKTEEIVKVKPAAKKRKREPKPKINAAVTDAVKQIAAKKRKVIVLEEMEDGSFKESPEQ